MSTQNLNICQVSLVGNIPVIKENYKNFCKFYDKLFFLLFVIFCIDLLNTNYFIICLYLKKNKKVDFIYR
jgi:hypothetical protein